MMVYQSFLPSPPLSEFVRNYTIIHFQFNSKEPIPSKQRSPKAEEKIVFYLKGATSMSNSLTGTKHTLPTVSIFGTQLDQRTIQMSAEFSAFIIFLRPGVLHRMIRMPLLELRLESSNAELFFGTEVKRVNEQLAAADSPSAMIAIAEQYLLAKCHRLEKKSAIDTIAAHLLADPTSFSLDRIAQQACLSTKQFHRKFTERIGISAKLFSRLSRFNHAYRYKMADPGVSWSSIAQQFSYTDYHHLEKEFKEFTGGTPQDWIKTDLAAPERTLKLR